MCNIVAGSILSAVVLFCFHYTHFAAQLELYKYCKLILNGRRRGALSFASC